MYTVQKRLCVCCVDEYSHDLTVTGSAEIQELYTRADSLHLGQVINWSGSATSPSGTAAAAGITKTDSIITRANSNDKVFFIFIYLHYKRAGSQLQPPFVDILTKIHQPIGISPFLIFTYIMPYSIYICPPFERNCYYFDVNSKTSIAGLSAAHHFFKMSSS